MMRKLAPIRKALCMALSAAMLCSTTPAPAAFAEELPELEMLDIEEFELETEPETVIETTVPVETEQPATVPETEAAPVETEPVVPETETAVVTEPVTEPVTVPETTVIETVAETPAAPETVEAPTEMPETVIAETEPQTEPVVETEAPGTEPATTAPVETEPVVTEPVTEEAVTEPVTKESETEEEADNAYLVGNIGDTDLDAGMVDQGRTLEASTTTNLNYTVMSPARLAGQMLTHVGKGYSLYTREHVNYYDCTSLTRRSANELGITDMLLVSGTGSVKHLDFPDVTYLWHEALKNEPIGTTVVLIGSGGAMYYKLTHKNTGTSEMAFVDDCAQPGSIILSYPNGVNNGHIVVSLGSFPRIDNQGDYASSTVINVVNKLSSTYGVSRTLLMASNQYSESHTVNTFLWDGALGTDKKKSDGTQSGPYNPIWHIEAYSPLLGTTVNNIPQTNTSGRNVRYILTPFAVSDTTKPSVTSVKASAVSADGYTVTCTFNAPAGIAQVKMPTWTTANGQDDLIWHVASISGNTATFNVKTSAHQNEKGVYTTHVYVTDILGRESGPYQVSVTVPVKDVLPVINSLGASGITYDKFTLTGAFTASSYKSVQFAVYNNAQYTKSGSKAIKWYNPTVKDGKATMTIKTADFNASGVYTAKMHVTGADGTLVEKTVSFTVPEKPVVLPVINSFVASNITADKFTLTGTFTAEEYKSIQYAVYSNVQYAASGSKAIKWYNPTISNGKAALTINTSDFNVSGAYTAKMHITAKNGTLIEKVANFTVPAKVVSSIDNVSYSILNDKSGYTVTVKFTAAGSNVSVQMPTWTSYGGQDDIVWHNATVSGKTATATILKSQHKNETGAYTTHVYLKDSTGTKIYGITVNLPAQTVITNMPTLPSGYDKVFDARYYYDNYPDLQKAYGKNGTLLWNHFQNNGMSEGRRASANFDPVAYRNRYSDLRAAFGTNWKKYYEHYINYGYKEGRNAK